MLNLKPRKIYAINQLTGTLVYYSLSPRKPEELGTVERCWGHKNKLASDKFKTVWGGSLSKRVARHLNFRVLKRYMESKATGSTNGREIYWLLINTGASAVLQEITEGHIAGSRVLWRKVMVCSCTLPWSTAGAVVYFLGGAATSGVCEVDGASFYAVLQSHVRENHRII